MKTASFRKQMLGVAIMAMFAFPLAGCRTRNNLPSTKMDCPTAITVSNLAQAGNIKGERIEVEVVYALQPRHFSFRVGDYVIGTDKRKLLEHLQAHGVTDVRFLSEYKMGPDDMRDFVRLFESVGIHVREFWVPRSSPPGRLDLMRGH